MKSVSKKEKKAGLFVMTRHMIGMGAKRKPLLLIFLPLLFICIGLSNTAYTFIKQIFFNSVEGLVGGSVQIGTVLFYGTVTSLFPVYLFVLGQQSAIMLQTFFKAAEGCMGKELNEKAAKIDPLVYEDNSFLDQINKAYTGLRAIGDVVVSMLMLLLNQSVYILSMAVYLFTVKPMLLVMFCICFMPNIIGTVVRKRMYANMEHKAAPYRRRYEYFEKCICSREYVKETRLWRAEGFFKRMYGKNLRECTHLDWQTSKHVLLIELGLRFLTLTGYVGTIIMLFYYLSKGEIGVGAFAAVFTSLDTLFSRINELFDGQIGAIGRSFGPAQNFFDFLALPERQGLYEGPVKREVIELKGVSFTYPGGSRPALENIDLTVHKGETIAIVGVNGSGKSTLTRLLTGLYLPTSGELLIDGRNVEEIAPKALYQNVSAVFQRYQTYKMTVAENVRISDVDRRASGDSVAAAGKAPGNDGGTAGKVPENNGGTAGKAPGNGVGTEGKVPGNGVGTEGKVPGNGVGTEGKVPESGIAAAGKVPGNAGEDPAGRTETAVTDVLEKADFPVDSEKLTEGLDTMLGKDFGGIDLSGGQWQRLAIARGLYRAHDMIILDEPTAAIDPLEEADIYRKFAEISADKTAFIVTHRLGSARIADRIIVMDAGHIVDMGTHEELMQREGKYRQMYHAQAKWYV